MKITSKSFRKALLWLAMGVVAPNKSALPPDAVAVALTTNAAIVSGAASAHNPSQLPFTASLSHAKIKGLM